MVVPGPQGVIPLAGQREGARQVVQILAKLSKMQDAVQFNVRELMAQEDKAIGSRTLPLA